MEVLPKKKIVCLFSVYRMIPPHVKTVGILEVLESYVHPEVHNCGPEQVCMYKVQVRTYVQCGSFEGRARYVVRHVGLCQEPILQEYSKSNLNDLISTAGDMYHIPTLLSAIKKYQHSLTLRTAQRNTIVE